jgi:uncharacterized damage-inducible protein DinB
MSLQLLISNYSAFNAWANQRIVTWLRTVDTELLYQQTPSSYTSLDYTLQHILRTQRYWLLFISEEDTSKVNWAIREGEVENIMTELITVSEEMKNKFSAFTEADLLKVLHLRSDWAQNDLPRYEYIQHIINHGTFHRGQIVTIARCVGITEGIVNTDYNIFNLSK